jgi:hypothetical protein
MRTRALRILPILLLCAVAAQAQKRADPPGMLPLGELGIFPKDKLTVDIDLHGPLLRLIAGATAGDDPDFAAMISGLQAIRLQVFPLAGADRAAVKGKVERAVRWLEDQGWASTVRVRDGDSEVYIYLKESGGKIVGLTVLALEPGHEAALINIVGRIDPAQLGRLGQRLDLPHLQRIPAKKPK